MVGHKGDEPNVMGDASRCATLSQRPSRNPLAEPSRCRRAAGGVFPDMARRPSLGELVLGGVVIAMVTFVTTQVVASPRRDKGASSGRTLTGRDSASIAEQYRSHVSGRGEEYAVPGWLAEIHIARLQAAAARDMSGEDAVPSMPADSVRALVATA